MYMASEKNIGSSSYSKVLNYCHRNFRIEIERDRFPDLHFANDGICFSRLLILCRAHNRVPESVGRPGPLAPTQARDSTVRRYWIVT
jgi:hypothetical protein